MAGDLASLGKTRTTAMAAGKLFESYYTCVETLFLRISQAFENRLSHDRWHADLLHKMRLRVEGVREPVLSERSHGILLEFLRFRHFSRYYYELDYDWDRIDFLRLKLLEVDPLIRDELKAYVAFLRKIEV